MKKYMKMANLIPIEIITKAEKCIRPIVKETPCEYSYSLSDEESQVYLKLENLQHTGSFKLRGTTNKLLSILEQEQNQQSTKITTVVTASSGNHGAATAYAGRKLNVKVIVFVPEYASKTKIEAIQRFGAEIRIHGNDAVITERFAREYSQKHKLHFISPYNDIDVIAGQASVGVELARQCANLDAVFVSTGGGGLISGIAAALKYSNPTIKIVACSPKNSAVLIESIKAGNILDIPSLPTLSDGTAGGVEEGSITFDIAQQIVDDFVLVTEKEIQDSLKNFISTEHMLIEGAAAVAIAAFQQTRSSYKNQKVALIICGANISLAALKTVIS